MRISKEGWMAIASFGLVSTIAGSIYMRTMEDSTQRRINDALTGPRSGETTPSGTVVISSSSGNVYETSTPTPKPVIVNMNGWSCAEINPPAVPNAFRAIKAAGNPKKWENGPYRYIPGKKGVGFGMKEKIVDSWGNLGMVYSGDKVCVKDSK